jgi:hypothetical protein
MRTSESLMTVFCFRKSVRGDDSGNKLHRVQEHVSRNEKHMATKDVGNLERRKLFSVIFLSLFSPLTCSLLIIF